MEISTMKSRSSRLELNSAKSLSLCDATYKAIDAVRVLEHFGIGREVRLRASPAPAACAEP